MILEIILPLFVLFSERGYLSEIPRYPVIPRNHTSGYWWLVPERGSLGSKPILLYPAVEVSVQAVPSI